MPFFKILSDIHLLSNQVKNIAKQADKNSADKQLNKTENMISHVSQVYFNK